MIHIDTSRGAGLDFNSWVDAILAIPDGTTIYDYSSDLHENDVFWLNFLLSWREREAPDVIKSARGIGAWWNPEYTIIVDKIHGPSNGHPYWNGLPKYKRLRPFNESKKARAFFSKLIQCANLNAHNTYVTPLEKGFDSSVRINQEFKALKMRKIIALGKNVYDVVQNIINTYPRYIETPDHYTKWSGRMGEYWSTFAKVVKS